MKIVKKIIIILIVVLLVNTSFVGFTSNAEENPDTLDSVTGEANGFVTRGKNKAQGVLDNAELVKKVKPLAQALRTIGIGIVLCVAAFMGIKWVTAKPDEQAKLKQQSVGLLVAAVVIIGAYTIWSIALKIVAQL